MILGDGNPETSQSERTKAEKLVEFMEKVRYVVYGAIGMGLFSLVQAGFYENRLSSSAKENDNLKDSLNKVSTALKIKNTENNQMSDNNVYLMDMLFENSGKILGIEKDVNGISPYEHAGMKHDNQAFKDTLKVLTDGEHDSRDLRMLKAGALNF